MSKLKSVFLVLFSLIFLISCDKDIQPTPCKTLKIAVLHSESGELSYVGLTSHAAIEIAEQEINADFANRDIPYRFEVTFFDTQALPELALDGLQGFANNGYKLVIGPQTSAEVANVKHLADSLGILLVSPASTANTLAISGDMIFRMVPGDPIEGAALANNMVSTGKQALITFARNDIANLGLQSSVMNSFIASGGIAVSAGTYGESETDFSAVLAEVKSQILNLSATYPANQIAVQLSSFDETTAIFNLASSDPILASVNWYGSDGFVNNQSLTQDPLAAQFAFNTHYFSPILGLTPLYENIWGPLFDDVFQITGIESEAFTASAFDALKIIAKLVEQQNGIPNTGALLQQAFLNSANGYIGATGLVQLNENGDRVNGFFDFWGIEYINGAYQWVIVGQSE